MGLALAPAKPFPPPSGLCELALASAIAAYHPCLQPRLPLREHPFMARHGVVRTHVRPAHLLDQRPRRHRMSLLQCHRPGPVARPQSEQVPHERQGKANWQGKVSTYPFWCFYTNKARRVRGSDQLIRSFSSDGFRPTCNSLTLKKGYLVKTWCLGLDGFLDFGPEVDLSESMLDSGEVALGETSSNGSDMEQGPSSITITES